MKVTRPSPADLARVVGLLRAAEQADTGEGEWDERQLREHWETIDLGRDAWLVELDGRLAGYADLEVRPGGRIMADGYVLPELRARGVGAELLRLTEEEARRRAEHIEGRVYLQNATTAAADALYRSHGYHTVRRFRRMVAELEQAPAVRAPAGIELRPLRPAEEREVHELLEDAFSSHWEHRRRSFEEYAKRTFDREDHDPSLCVVAHAETGLAGASLNWWKNNGDWGWIGVLGVHPALRGRGIGAGLLLASFAEFFRRGERRIALGVDAQNETGAARLYERHGMRTLWEAPIWEKELRAA